MSAEASWRREHLMRKRTVRMKSGDWAWGRDMAPNIGLTRCTPCSLILGLHVVSLNIWRFTVHVLLKPGGESALLVCERSAVVQ